MNTPPKGILVVPESQVSIQPTGEQVRWQISDLDWRRLRNCIDKLEMVPPWLHDLAFTLIGVAIGAFVTLRTWTPTAEQKDSFATIGIIFWISLIGFIFCTILKVLQKRIASTSFANLKQELDYCEEAMGKPRETGDN